MDKEHIVIIGAGGHGKVVAATLLAMGEHIAGFVDEDPRLHGQIILGYPVLGSTSLLHSLPGQAAIIAIGNNQLRKHLATELSHLRWKTGIHPRAWVDNSVSIGQGSMIFAGSMIQPNSIIGEHAIINTACSIDHDSHIGNFTHIAPGCHLAGNVQIKEGAFIGIHSCAIPSVQVGAWALVGAGSVITKSISPYTKAKGQPAKEYLILER